MNPRDSMTSEVTMLTPSTGTTSTSASTIDVSANRYGVLLLVTVVIVTAKQQHVCVFTYLSSCDQGRSDSMIGDTRQLECDGTI